MPRTSRTQRLVMLTASTALAAGGVLLPTSAFAAPALPHTGAVATAAAHHDGNSDRDSWNGKGKGGDWNGKGKGGDWNGKGKGGGCKGGKGPDPKPLPVPKPGGGPVHLHPKHNVDPAHPNHTKRPVHPVHLHPKHNVDPAHPNHTKHPKPGGIPIDNGPVLQGIPGE
ncbi:hypothetical protein ACH40F_44325 [Streptomyces sp. NPDC020794]|uniref:hypothetical protein n=1 Tax=unclassified Streptomyces TaxID=2593676 RepID=UPI0036E4DFD2